MTKQVYNKEHLLKVTEGIILGDIDYSKLNRDTKIPFTCPECKSNTTKTFRYIDLSRGSGALCAICSKKAATQKGQANNLVKYGTKRPMPESPKFNMKLLLKVMTGVTLLQTIYKQLTRDTEIYFKCKNCLCETYKEFRWIVERGGPYCRECTQKRRMKNLEIYYTKKIGYKSNLSDPNYRYRYICYRKKIYEFPNGKKVKCQGYEPYALDLLISCGFTDKDIITDLRKVPEIYWYEKNGKKHRHYVDIYIPKENWCIEVKSPWTFHKDKDTNLEKKKEAEKLGYIYQIWIIESNGEIINII